MKKVTIYLVMIFMGIRVETFADSGQDLQSELGAFQNTRQYQLAPNSYSLDYYNNVISNVFLKFLRAFPQSPLCADVENSLKNWVSERDHVAQGSIKSNNQWYHGDEAKQMIAKMRFTQLLAEGDRQLEAGKYEPALQQYQQALKLNPITQEALDLIEVKCEHAFVKWTAAAKLAPANLDSEIQSRRQTIERLQSEIEQKSQEIRQIEQQNFLIGSARWFDRSDYRFRSGRCPTCRATQGHWIAANGHDFGPTLPKQNTLGLAALRRTISDAQNEIGKHNAVIASLQSGATTGPQMLEAIEKMRMQLSSEIANRKAVLTGQQPKMEVVSSVVNTAVVQQITSAPAESVQSLTSQPAMSPDQMPAPVEAKPPVSQAGDSEPKKPSPEKQPWWKEYWYLVVIGIIGAFYILRR